jgi:hypothetical protein
MHKSFAKPGEYVFWSFLKRHGLTISEPRQISLLDFIRYDLGPAKPIIRRSFIECHQLAYDPTLFRGEDFIFYFEALTLEARWLQLPHGYYLWSAGRDGSLSSDHFTLWQDVINNVQPLFEHPVVMNDVSLATALESFVRRSRSILTVGIIRDMLRRRHFTEVVQLLLKQPSTLLLIGRAFVRRFRLRRLLVRRYKSTERDAFRDGGRRLS